jgi:hypothetical protein
MRTITLQCTQPGCDGNWARDADGTWTKGESKCACWTSMTDELCDEIMKHRYGS